MTLRITKETESQHLLLDVAQTYPVSPLDLAPPGCHYSLLEGAWILDDLETLLADTPGRTMPSTKKSDNETGEDQKGA